MQLENDPDWVAQAKINGQRAVWHPPTKTLWSRGDKPIVRSPEVLAALASVRDCVDGEFVPVVGKQKGTYWMFDLPDHRGTYEERLKAVAELVKKINSPVIKLAPPHIDWLDVDLNEWEGVVFKRLASKYPKAGVDGKTTPDWVKYRAEWL
jgi:ATP-dependent DNA ligase